MKHNKLFDVIGKLFDVIGTVLLGVGFFFAFLPHTNHVSVGFDGETSNLTHVIIGMVLVVVGLGVLVYNNKALKMWKR